MSQTTDTMYRYYERQTILPTFANLRDEAALAAYEGARRRLFTEKLSLPPRIFHDAAVLQYGPDSGEDALVFARWGAHLTLVEPNPSAIDVLHAYFEKFGLKSRLTAIENVDLETFAPEGRFDFIDAEGFIYTIQPSSRWLSRFAQQLNPDGFFLITAYETTGAVLELCLKALHCAGRALSGGSSVDTARALYQTKWDSIPHTRAFESWVMDCLENPFVRRRYFFDAAEFCELASDFSFELHASWPVYRDALDMYWHKKGKEYGALRFAMRRHLARSTLSLFFGQKLYLVDDDEAAIENVKTAFDRIGALVDSAIDAYDSALCASIARAFDSLDGRIASLRTFVDDADTRVRASRLLQALARAFDLAAAGAWQELRAVTNGDDDFIRAWGMPAPPMVFRRILG